MFNNNDLLKQEKKYDETIDVFKQTLPSDHRLIGETYHNIGKLYCCTYAFDKALDYFNQAKEI
jgi:tetratricopeptide (TPR) repeat protein